MGLSDFGESVSIIFMMLVALVFELGSDSCWIQLLGGHYLVDIHEYLNLIIMRSAKVLSGTHLYYLIWCEEITTDDCYRDLSVYKMTYSALTKMVALYADQTSLCFLR